LQIDLYVAAAGLFVGFTVGLTGMGGGALMTRSWCWRSTSSR
jgi:uncharacterized membrane protein YfcA